MKRTKLALLAGAFCPIVSFSQTVLIGAELQPVSNYSVEYDEQVIASGSASNFQQKLFNVVPLLFWQYTGTRGNTHMVKIGYMREHYSSDSKSINSGQTYRELFDEVWHNVYFKYGYGQEGTIGPVRFNFGLDVPVILHPADDFTYSYENDVTSGSSQYDVASGQSKFNVEYGLGAFLFLHTRLFGHFEGGVNFSLDYTYWKRAYKINETNVYTDGFGNTNTSQYTYTETFKTFSSTQFFPSITFAYRLERPMPEVNVQ